MGAVNLTVRSGVYKMSIQHWLALGLAGLLWGACTPEPPPAAGDDDDDDVLPSPTGETGEPPTGETGDSGTTSTPWDTEVDCEAILPVPVESVRYDWVASSEDYTFSADGYLIQSSGGGVRRTPFGGPSELILPGAPEARGTRFLPDGRLALNAIETGSVVLVDVTTGSQEVVAAGLQNPNGMAIDLQGRIYVTVTAGVMRIDPSTGAVDRIVDMPGNSFDGITFSHDYGRLYFNEELGQIHFVEIDEDGEAGPVRDGVRINLSAFSILDGMAADACGNLYALEMDGTVWRVRLDGTIEVVAELPGTPISFPALNFGYPPVGGWGSTALYVLTFTGQLHELQIGVPGKWEPHLPPQN
jgi:hypothetical protein